MGRESDQGRSIIHLNSISSSSSSQGTSRGRVKSHATHPNIRLGGDGAESRVQHRTQDAGDDDAEKKIWEEKKGREKFELMLESEFGTWISRMSTPPRRN